MTTDIDIPEEKCPHQNQETVGVRGADGVEFDVKACVDCGEFGPFPPSTQLPRLALSVRQPWAWAIIFAGKDIENRSVAAVRHGMKPAPIAIHASKGMTQCEYEHAAEFMASIGVTCPAARELVRGGVIGHCEITGIVDAHDSPWFFGPRGLVLANPTPCDPIAAVGALGYFRWERGGELDEPKKWMLAEPPGPAPEPITTLPLFDGPES